MSPRSEQGTIQPTQQGHLCQGLGSGHSPSCSLCTLPAQQPQLFPSISRSGRRGEECVCSQASVSPKQAQGVACKFTGGRDPCGQMRRAEVDRRRAPTVLPTKASAGPTGYSGAGRDFRAVESNRGKKACVPPHWGGHRCEPSPGRDITGEGAGPHGK